MVSEASRSFESDPRSRHNRHPQVAASWAITHTQEQQLRLVAIVKGKEERNCVLERGAKSNGARWANLEISRPPRGDEFTTMQSQKGLASRNRRIRGREEGNKGVIGGR